MGDDERATARKKLAESREKAVALTPEQIKERNRKALEKRKAEQARKKAEEASRPLPEGWRRVESKSRPGEFVYENVHTEERQAWFPEVTAPEQAAAPLVAQSEDEARKAALKEKNRLALEKRKAALAAQKAEELKVEPPAGWKRVESRSTPGEFVYENTVTGDRQAWFPDAPCVEVDPKKEAALAKNKAALEAFKAKKAAEKEEEAQKALPDGWKRVESRSRPGEFVYENLHTEERQAWFPDAPAEKPLPEGWRKVESRSYPGEYVYENINTGDRQAWRPDEEAPIAAVAPAEKTAAQRTAEQLAELKRQDAEKASKIVCTATAQFDFTAGNPDEEIDMIEGDVISVEYKAENGWWVGTNQRTGRNGIFPGTYVEEISQ